MHAWRAQRWRPPCFKGESIRLAWSWISRKLLYACHLNTGRLAAVASSKRVFGKVFNDRAAGGAGAVRLVQRPALRT